MFPFRHGDFTSCDAYNDTTSLLLVGVRQKYLCVAARPLSLSLSAGKAEAPLAVVGEDFMGCSAVIFFVPGSFPALPLFRRRPKIETKNKTS